MDQGENQKSQPTQIWGKWFNLDTDTNLQTHQHICGSLSDPKQERAHFRGGGQKQKSLHQVLAQQGVDIRPPTCVSSNILDQSFEPRNSGDSDTIELHWSEHKAKHQLPE